MSERPRLLDLFCGAGGAARGYHDAGFEVVGVDIKRQPNYPYEFICEDATKFLDSFWHPYPVWKISDFDAIHASPPCQSFTAYRRKGHGVGVDYPDLIAKVREDLEDTGLPYVIENVPGAPLDNPVQLCGSSFGLDVRRHRLFESNVPMMVPPCDHSWQTPRFPGATNREPLSRSTVEIGVWRIPLDVQHWAMGIDWMTLEELSEAIPPVYTAHVGSYLMAAVQARAIA